MFQGRMLNLGTNIGRSISVFAWIIWLRFLWNNICIIVPCWNIARLVDVVHRQTCFYFTSHTRTVLVLLQAIAVARFLSRQVELSSCQLARRRPSTDRCNGVFRQVTIITLPVVASFSFQRHELALWQHYAVLRSDVSDQKHFDGRILQCIVRDTPTILCGGDCTNCSRKNTK